MIHKLTQVLLMITCVSGVMGSSKTDKPKMQTQVKGVWQATRKATKTEQFRRSAANLASGAKSLVGISTTPSIAPEEENYARNTKGIADLDLTDATVSIYQRIPYFDPKDWFNAKYQIIYQLTIDDNQSKWTQPSGKTIKDIEVSRRGYYDTNTITKVTFDPRDQVRPPMLLINVRNNTHDTIIGVNSLADPKSIEKLANDIQNTIPAKNRAGLEFSKAEEQYLETDEIANANTIGVIHSADSSMTTSGWTKATTYRSKSPFTKKSERSFKMQIAKADGMVLCRFITNGDYMNSIYEPIAQLKDNTWKTIEPNKSIQIALRSFNESDPKIHYILVPQWSKTQLTPPESDMDTSILNSKILLCSTKRTASEQFNNLNNELLFLGKPRIPDIVTEVPDGVIEV